MPVVCATVQEKSMNAGAQMFLKAIAIVREGNSMRSGNVGEDVCSMLMEHRILDPPTPILGIEPYIYELPGSNIAIGEGDRPGLAFAVQLKEAQIHTDAVIKLASLVQAVVNARSERRVVIIIEGSAHPRERKVSGVGRALQKWRTFD